jgi:hypothetical protein
MTKKIRSKVVKESLLDYNTLANSLKENTESAVKSLLDEAVRDTYAKLLSEDDDKDYEEDEVEDTDSDASDDAVETSDDSATDDIDTDDIESDDEDADTDTEMELDSDDNDDEVDTADDSDGDDAWAEFDKYKVSDDEYDFSDAEDEEIVKVYKLMKNDDQILVHKSDDDKVSIKDNETGAEYLIDLGDDSSVDNDDELLNDEDDDFSAAENDLDDMNESQERMFELVLEYDSNVGYTDNYQKKDVMTNPGMSEPGKNVSDWDAGVPHGNEKPWSKKSKKADKPFNGGNGKKLEEDDDMSMDGGDEAPMTESAAECGGRMGAHGRSIGTKTHKPNSGKRNAPYNQHHVSVAGEYESNPSSVDENIKRRINKALRENKELRSTLNGVMTSLKEAAVTNHNLAQIIKLVSENTTSQDEKQEIISRFAKEAKTIQESKNLYNTISNELKKTNKMNITENANLSVNGTQRINETTIYKSPDVMDSLDLMHRMMK